MVIILFPYILCTLFVALDFISVKGNLVRVVEKLIINPARHLRSKAHVWSKENSVAAVGQFGLREKTVSAKGEGNELKFKNYHRLRMCPIAGCMKVVTSVFI